MKKCDNCGAVQSDDRIFCLDCGERLGRPMSEAEARAHEAALSNTIGDMAERTEDFYVSPTARALGVISILCALLLVMLIPLIIGRIDSAQNEYLVQMGATKVGQGSYIVQHGDSVGMFSGNLRAPSAEALEKTLICALFGLFFFVSAALFLLIPKVMWWFETLRYRLWFDADPRPSFYATAIYAVIKYGCFGLGCAMLITVLVKLF